MRPKSGVKSNCSSKKEEYQWNDFERIDWEEEGDNCGS